MAAALTSTIQNLRSEIRDVLTEIDKDFRANREKEKSLGMGCGVCVYRLNGRQVELLLGELQGKKDARMNGRYATFSGKPKEEDFTNREFEGSEFAPLSCAQRELREEFGLSAFAFVEACYLATTQVVKNNAYRFFLNPIFFIKSTPAIERVVESFQGTKEVRRIRWIDAGSSIKSAKKIQQVYQKACRIFRLREGPRLREEWNQGREIPLTDQEFTAQLESYIRKNKDLEAIRDGDPRGIDVETGESIPIAPYSSRSILEASPVIQQIIEARLAGFSEEIVGEEKV